MVDAATLPAAAVAPRSRWVLWVAVAVPLLAACAPRDLWAPDEPRYGLVAQGMLDTGDLLVPRINGQPYAEKPPLAFAAMAATGLVTGEVTAVGARLACAAFAALAVFLVARLARRWFRDAATAETAALLFSTTGLVLWNGSRAALDLPMTACGLLALDAGTTLLERRSWPAALGFGAALGAGLLVKGPHVFYVPLAALVGGALASGRGRRLLDPRWLVGLALALGLAAAWLVPAVARAGDALAYNDDVSFGRRVLGQLSDRVAGDDVPHEHGPLYLFPLLLAFGLPWTPAWLLALPAALRPRRAPEGDRLGLGAAAWGLLVPLLALSLPRSKRELYLVPLLAATAWLGAYGLHRGIGPRGRGAPAASASPGSSRPCSRWRCRCSSRRTRSPSAPTSAPPRAPSAEGRRPRRWARSRCSPRSAAWSRCACATGPSPPPAPWASPSRRRGSWSRPR